MLNIINDLANEPGRNAKIDILEKNRDNELLKKVIGLALDPMKQFYIRKIPSYTRDQDTSLDLNMALDSLSQLSDREVTGNAAIEFLRVLLTSLTEDDAVVLERVIQKDLKCGVAGSTANKVWSKLIPTYPCMLCTGFEPKLIDKFSFPSMVQLKADGMRFNAIVRNGKVDFRSRNGKEINLLGFLEQEFIDLAAGQSLVFDGELLVIDPTCDVNTIMDRQTGNGILNKAVRGTISEGEAKMVNASLWDVIPYKDFVEGYSPIAYIDRWEILNDLTITREFQNIHLIANHRVGDIEQANKIFQTYLDMGQEGIILKDLGAPWEDKRVKHQIKFKGELECDLKVTAIEPGTGKYEGMLGAVQCESADGIVKVKVGSGFNEDHRTTYGQEVIGKIVAVKYNARIKNKQGEESLFLPIFLEFREDKSIADTSGDIK
mgnify:CR=1 FL=1